MSKKELLKYHVIQSSLENKITVKQAAQRLQLSERRIKQLRKEFKEKGAVAMIHGNSRRTSPKKLPSNRMKRILNLRETVPFNHSNFTHFHEILASHYDIHLSYSSLYRLLSSHGFTSPKSRRKKKTIHKTRERKPAEGMMLQADATPFPWFGHKINYSLHGFIDDATGKITGLYLCKNECLLGYLEVLRQTLTSFGIPQSLYPDRSSVFFVNPKKAGDLSVEEQLSGLEKRVTQFGRIVKRFGIDMFPAHSPQAKGRIERLWDTLQSRLPVELALRGITTMEAANEFLKEYIPTFNEQFSVSPQESYSAYVPVPEGEDLDRLLCATYTRKLSAGSTVSLYGRTFFIEQKKFYAKTEVQLLLSEKHGLRALIHGAFYPLRLVVGPSNALCSKDYMPEIINGLIQRLLLRNTKVA